MAQRFAMLCAIALLWIPEVSRAFAVAPATLDLSGARGTAVTGTVSIINDDDAERTYYLGTLGFVPDESSGSPEFLPTEADHTGLADWIAFPVGEIAIPARTKVDAPFVATIPKDVPSGTYHAAVTVSTAPSEVVASNGASIEAKLAVLVFLTVEGETVEKLALLDFVRTDAGLVDAHDLSYAFRVQNQGNVVAKPVATITVTDALGRVVFARDANPDAARVLPGTTRTFADELVDRPEGLFQIVTSQWSRFAVGPVTATLRLEGADATDVATIRYWMLPWQLILGVIGAIVLLKLVWNGLARRKSNLDSISTGT